MAGLSYKIYSLGCKVNQYDGDKLGGLLKSAGFIFADKDADVAIINSCAVTVSAIAKSRAMIKKARTENPGAKIILAGCWPRVYEKEVSAIGVDIIWGKKFSELMKKINYVLAPAESPVRGLCRRSNIWQSPEAETLPWLATDNSEKSRYFLKIQDGCEQFCAYCIIPYTRGKLHSRPMAEVFAEAETAVASGWQEIVLTGIHLGLFGVNSGDKKSGPALTHPVRAARPPLSRGDLRDENLLALLKKLVNINGLKKIRLSSIEVTEVGDELIDFMAREPKMCRHLHIPLQAGSDKILRLMKRPYDLKYFADKIKKLRKKMPDIAISTDVIVGFPGETAKDFQGAEKFIKKIKFSRLHVFSFSAHALTPAAKMPDKVAPPEMKRRSEILRNLSDKLSVEYQKKFAGKILEVVVEQNRSSRTGKSKGEKLKGKTEYYFDVFFDRKNIISKNPPPDLIGQVVKVKNI